MIERTNQGWVCPKCGKVWSPTSDRCWTCNYLTAHHVPHTSTGTDTGVDPLANKPVTTSRYTLSHYDFNGWPNNQENKR